MPSVATPHERGYSSVSHDDLERLVGQRTDEVASREHFAQFYELDDALLDAVAHYLGVALRAGDAAIAVATAAHAPGIDQRLHAAGLDPAGLHGDGRYLPVDANATLSLVMVDGVPQQQRFFEIIGGAIDQLARGGRRVRAFGEMVAVLAAEGRYDTAVQLEMLWNELGKTRSFALLCGYPMKLFTGQELDGPLGEVAQAHDHVVPTESVMHLPVDARMRKILSLQQKARSLEAEVAQRRAAENRLRVALLAEQAARAEAESALRQRDEFVSVASHELKTPLTTLAGFAQLVLRRFNRDGELDPQRVVPALHSITNQADRLARLLGHLLDVSRLDESKLTLERQPTEVIALIEQTVGPARLWSEKHTFVVSAPSTLVAEVDALRLEQVLTNLLDNAVKYSPDGGSVDVQVAKRRGFMELAIRDHGLGIPANRRRQIFERFYQAHSSGYRSGLGLGLYISRQIVELHGGSIRAEFPRGGGTRFVVRLPLKQPLAERSPTLQLAAD